MKNSLLLKHALAAGAACAAMSFVSIGQAGSLSTTGWTGEYTTISYNGVQESTAALAFTGATFNGSPIDPFWCIDITHTIPYPAWGPFDYDSAIFQAYPLTPPDTFDTTQVGDLRKLFANHYPTDFNDANQTAAFQLAIWDILFDDDLNLSTYTTGFGVVSISDNGLGTIGLAQGWLGALSNEPASSFPLTQYTDASYYTPDGRVNPNHTQSFIDTNVRRLTTVPEPNELALFGAALGAMALMMRRRKVGLHTV